MNYCTRDRNAWTSLRECSVVHHLFFYINSNYTVHPSLTCCNHIKNTCCICFHIFITSCLRYYQMTFLCTVILVCACRHLLIYQMTFLCTHILVCACRHLLIFYFQSRFAHPVRGLKFHRFKCACWQFLIFYFQSRYAHPLRGLQFHRFKSSTCNRFSSLHFHTYTEFQNLVAVIIEI